MATFEHESYVDAPLSDVWEFHSNIAGLQALTPDWMDLRVEAARGPDGEPDPEVLDEGTIVELSMCPFGIGPRQRWTSHIVERREGEGVASFRDEMVDGPFARWIHSHYFYADDGGTRVRDRVEYALPGGEFGRLAGPFAVVGFDPMFRYRHRKTRVLLGHSEKDYA